MYAMGKEQEAIKEFQKLLESDSQSIAGNMGIAAMYEAQKQNKEAAEHYKKVLNIQPNNPIAANNLAWLLALDENGDLGEALRLAMQAKQSLPDDANISDTLGWIHYKRQSYSLAMGQFQQALTANPDNATVGYHLALAQYANGDKKSAVQTLGKILAGKQKFSERTEAEKLERQWKTEL